MLAIPTAQKPRKIKLSGKFFSKLQEYVYSMNISQFLLQHFYFVLTGTQTLCSVGVVASQLVIYIHEQVPPAYRFPHNTVNWPRLGHWNAWPLQIKALCSFKTTGTTQLLTQSHILEHLNPQQHCCGTPIPFCFLV